MRARRRGSSARGEFTDFGDDEYTQGRAHPMIDPSLRLERLAAAARDPGVSVLLLDVVLGYGAHPDPAAELAPVIAGAVAARAQHVVVALCGAAADPQGLDRQREALEARRGGRHAQQRARRPAGAGGLRWLTCSGRPLAVANAGVDLFADELERQGVPVERVEWRPPEPGTADALARLALEAAAIARANDEAVKRLDDAQPLLVGVGVARDLLPDMGERTILHAGPPIDWADMSGPLRGAVIGAAVHEGLASDREDAARRAGRRRVRVRAVPRARRGRADGGRRERVDADVRGRERGARQPRVLHVQRRARQGAALRRVRRRGARPPARGSATCSRACSPARSTALGEPIDLRAMTAQALQMGDEGHNRNRAGTSLLLRTLLPALIELDEPAAKVAAVARFIAGNDHFYLNLTMPASKAAADAAAGIDRSSIVVAMARNGTEFGVRLSGTGDRWFTGPSGIDRRALPARLRPEDANPDIGDSTITETVGLGGFAMAAAPAIVRFVGGGAEDALAATRAMYDISWGESRSYQIPALGFRGTPLGIDCRDVVHTRHPAVRQHRHRPPRAGRRPDRRRPRRAADGGVRQGRTGARRTVIAHAVAAPVVGRRLVAVG